MLAASKSSMPVNPLPHNVTGAASFAKWSGVLHILPKYHAS